MCLCRKLERGKHLVKGKTSDSHLQSVYGQTTVVVRIALEHTFIQEKMTNTCMEVSDSQVCVFLCYPAFFLARFCVDIWQNVFAHNVVCEWIAVTESAENWEHMTMHIFLFISSTHLWLKTGKHASCIRTFSRHKRWHYNKLFANSSRVNRLWWVLSWNIWALCR